MEQKLHDYFCGHLSTREKYILLKEVAGDEALKARFIELQHVYAVAELLPREGDELVARRGLSKISWLRARRVVGWVAAACVAVAVMIGVLGRDEVRLAEAVAPLGKRLELSLSDGTKVWLAPRSRLVYPVEFNGDRTVELTGEALFDVAKGTPFEISSGGYKVRVLGTVFNVSSYDGVFETTLIEGSVEVFDRNSRIVLEPGSQAYLDEGRLASRVVDSSQALCLQNGIYNFHDITLGQIMSRLEVWYGVQIDIRNSGLMNAPFAAKFREQDDIDTIMRALQNTSDFRYRYDSAGNIVIY